ncbi:MAG: hypothetical protein R3B09_04250 [Nannocystaceae bacterium]
MSHPGAPGYWSEPLSPTACAQMVAKYEALAWIEGAAAGRGRDLAIREAAARWPGSLRESQLAGPERCRERREAANRGARAPARTRAAWAGECPALPLWVDLHALLRDQRGFRGRPGDPGSALQSFLAGVAGTGRWGDPDEVAAIAGPRVHSRQAYRWLAARAGLALPRLNYLLFGRDGHWDLRAGDPPRSAPDPSALPIEISRFFPLPWGSPKGTT